MKKHLLVLLSLFLFGSAFAGNTKPTRDSITDNWSIIYNGKEVLGYTINGVKTYMIDSIADNGVIIIDYYTDQPCDKCQSRLQFRDENGKVKATVEKEGFGSGNPFRLPGMQFRQLMHNHKLWLYFSANPNGWGTWILLGVVVTNK